MKVFPRSPTRRFFAFGVAAVAVLLATGFACAQEEAETEVEAAEGMAVMANPGFTDETFDQWLFNGNHNMEWARGHFDSQLTLQIESVHGACGITPLQRKKLLLAGRGDVVRFFEKIELARKKFQALKHDQNKIGEIFNEIRPLQGRMGLGLFGPGSLFDKTLKGSLSAEQLQTWVAVDRSRRQFQYRAKVELIVSMLGDSIVLSETQREEMLKFLLDETKAPRQTGQYDYYVVMYQLSRVPEERYAKLLRPAQRRALEKQLNQVRGIEAFLKQQGLLEIDEEETVKAVPAAGGRADGT